MRQTKSPGPSHSPCALSHQRHLPETRVTRAPWPAPTPSAHPRRPPLRPLHAGPLPTPHQPRFSVTLGRGHGNAGWATPWLRSNPVPCKGGPLPRGLALSRTASASHTVSLLASSWSVHGAHVGGPVHAWQVFTTTSRHNPTGTIFLWAWRPLPASAGGFPGPQPLSEGVAPTWAPMTDGPGPPPESACPSCRVTPAV